jgi:hypothetical protein
MYNTKKNCHMEYKLKFGQNILNINIQVGMLGAYLCLVGSW